MENAINKVKDEEQIKAIFESLKENIDDLIINIVIFEKKVTDDKDKKYIAKTFNVKKGIIKDYITEVLNNCLDDIIKRRLAEYDLELSLDETLQTVSAKEVIYGSLIIDKIINVSGEIDEQTSFDKIKFIGIELKLKTDKEDYKLYLFKKYFHPTTKFKKSFKYIITGKEIKGFDKQILTLEPHMDVYFIDDIFYVSNRNNFNNIFEFKDIFEKIIDSNIDEIKDSDLFLDATQFISDCKDDGRYLPRLTKVILAKGFDKTVVHSKNLPDLKKDFNLKIKLSDTNQIMYNDKNDIGEILNILLEHYVISALTNNRMLAKAIENYKIKGE